MLGSLTAVPIDDMPDKFTGGAAPVEYVKHGRVWILLQHFVATVFLRSFESFVRVDLQKRCVKNLRRRVGWTVTVFRTRRNSALGSILGIGSGPYIGFGAVSARRRKEGAPHVRFAVSAFAVGSDLRLQPERLCSSSPTACRHENFLERIAPGLQFGPFWLRFLRRSGLRRFRGTACHDANRQRQHRDTPFFHSCTRWHEILQPAMS